MKQVIHFEVSHILEAVTKLIGILIPKHIIIKFDGIKIKLQRDDEEEVKLLLGSIQLTSNIVSLSNEEIQEGRSNNGIESIAIKVTLDQMNLLIHDKNKESTFEKHSILHLHCLHIAFQHELNYEVKFTSFFLSLSL